MAAFRLGTLGSVVGQTADRGMYIPLPPWAKVNSSTTWGDPPATIPPEENIERGDGRRDGWKVEKSGNSAGFYDIDDDDGSSSDDTGFDSDSSADDDDDTTSSESCSRKGNSTKDNDDSSYSTSNEEYSEEIENDTSSDDDKEASSSFEKSSDKEELINLPKGMEKPIALSNQLAMQS